MSARVQPAGSAISCDHGSDADGRCATYAYCAQRLRQAVSPAQLLRLYGLHVHLQPEGRELVGPCPIHRGQAPRAFRVELAPPGRWSCFSGACHQRHGGDAIGLALCLEAGNWAWAGRVLAHLAHGGPEPPRSHFLPPPPPRSPDPSATPRTPDDGGGAAPESPWDPRAYLAARGILPETAERYGITVAAAAIQVPLHDAAGHLLGVGRRIAAGWRWPAGFPRRSTLYAHAHARPHVHAGDPLVVVEGVADVLRVAQAGWPAVVGLLGAHATPEQVELLRRAPRVVLLLDGDDAGRAGAQALAGLLGERATALAVPDGDDPAALRDADLAELLCSVACCLPAPDVAQGPGPLPLLGNYRSTGVLPGIARDSRPPTCGTAGPSGGTNGPS